MADIIIGPGEKRDQHIKVYVEPSVKKAMLGYQRKRGTDSFSEAARDLLIAGIKAVG